ncbi:MAG: hypothetical protein JXR68_07935 [Bacteroidales bacterium]|nr:hypothetical protein [Bacteroidales bacterium]
MKQIAIIFTFLLLTIFQLNSAENVKVGTNSIGYTIDKQDYTHPALIQKTKGLITIFAALFLIGAGIYSLFGNFLVGLILIGLGVGILVLEFYTVKQTLPPPNNNNNNNNKSKGKTNGRSSSTSKGKTNG